MKKRQHILIVFVSVMVMCLAPVFVKAENPESIRDKALDALFASGGIIRLEEVELNSGEIEGPACALDLSPDGETVLWRYQTEEDGTGLALVRKDGATVPVSFVPRPAVGDPFDKEKYLLSAFRSWKIPGSNGPGWSADGRYVSFYDWDAINNRRSADVPVLDTSTGNLYFADTYSKDHSSEDGGLVVLSQISRRGDLLVYLLIRKAEGQFHYQLCSCLPQGGGRQMLYDIPLDDPAFFDLSASSLMEDADGSWLLTGIHEYMNGDRKKASLALLRFTPAEDGWTAKLHSLHIPKALVYNYTRWSSKSRYGLFCISSSMLSTAGDMAAMEMTPDMLLSQDLLNYVNLVRILPGEDLPHDIWYIMDTENGPELLPAEDYLWPMKLYMAYVEEDESGEALQRLHAAVKRTGITDLQKLEDLFPEGYDMDFYTQSMQYRMHATCACLSPDGYYALVNAGSGRNGFKMYLISLETMQLRPVEVPEGINGFYLTNTSAAGGYLPRMLWNEDGTILIRDGAEQIRTRAFRINDGF